MYCNHKYWASRKDWEHRKYNLQVQQYYVNENIKTQFKKSGLIIYMKEVASPLHL